MTTQPISSDSTTAREEAALPFGWMKSIWARLLTLVRACAAQWQARALYDQLPGLSSPELDDLPTAASFPHSQFGLWRIRPMEGHQ